jgi:hypothetical protein
MATEFVDGVTLRQLVSNRRLKLIDLLDAAIQIVAALNAAHQAGVRKLYLVFRRPLTLSLQVILISS